MKRHKVYGDLMKIQLVKRPKTADETSYKRDFFVSAWSGTSASFPTGRLGHYFRFNVVNPTSEKSHLLATNDGSFFTD